MSASGARPRVLGSGTVAGVRTAGIVPALVRRTGLFTGAPRFARRTCSSPSPVSAVGRRGAALAEASRRRGALALSGSSIAGSSGRITTRWSQRPARGIVHEIVEARRSRLSASVRPTHKMPSFQVIGHGRASGRKRKRDVRALDRATVLEIMEAEGTVVDECIELPYPAAEKALAGHLAHLGVAMPAEPSRPACVFEILNWCIRNRRVASVQYLTDVEGNPWRTRVEPHGFRKSKEGFRVRCCRPEEPDEPDVVNDFQASGWHFYLIEDIDWAEATPASFQPRPYTRNQDEVSIVISFRAPA